MNIQWTNKTKVKLSDGLQMYQKKNLCTPGPDVLFMSTFHYLKDNFSQE